MNPVWMVRSRHLMTRFRFWLIVSGYDPRDNSLTQKIYLVYAGLFWALWIFAVLALAASGMTDVLQALNPGFVAETAVLLLAIGLLGWALYSAYSATRRSPIIFSEDDAYLICQTPVDRRQVTLAWLVGDWPTSGILFWILGSILGFTLVEARLNGLATFNDFPDYLFSALLCLSVIIPFHFGLLAAIWALGVTHLQADQHKSGLSWLPILIGGLVIVNWLAQSARLELPGWLVQLLGFGLSPLLLPIQASLGLADWRTGEIIAFLWLIMGVGVLIHQSVRFNLSRAAQETSLYDARQKAIFNLDRDAARELSIKQHLGVGKHPSNLPIPDGLGAMLWKDVVQSIRSLQLSALFPWLQLFGAAAGVFFAQDWGLRLMALALWILFSSQIISRRLRLDLSHWAIFAQLPFDSLRLIVTEISLPVLGSVLVNWLALWLAGRCFSLPDMVGITLLIPGLTLGMALITAWDIFRQCKSENLLVGAVPGFDAWNFIVGFGVMLILFILFGWLTLSLAFPLLAFSVTFLANVLMLIGLSGLVKSSYRNIQ